MAEFKGYPTTETYKDIASGSFKLGKSLASQRSKKAVDLSKYENVRQASQEPTGSGTNFQDLGPITTPYGGSTNYEAYHPGIDVAMAQGASIPSTVGGKVTEVVGGKKWTPDTPSFGNYVVIQDEKGNFHRFSHLSNSFVEVGQDVVKGTSVGSAGGTGSTYSQHNSGPGYHLDYRIYDLAKKYYFNPLTYLK